MKVADNPATLAIFIFSLWILTLLSHGSCSSPDQQRKSYIVYMGELPEAGVSVMDDHHSLLSTAIGDEQVAKESKIYSYGRSFNGFAARLLPHEAERLADEEGVTSVFENTLHKLHTTRSWDFLGLPEKTINKRVTSRESDLIVGVLDSGIWPEAPSFSDEGLGPVPAKWKGKCVKKGNFTGCNRKVIGAKAYDLEHIHPGEDNPLDYEGHGSHTSSTIAGTPVTNASLYGIGKGTARGGAPGARIAMYKVCYPMGCSDLDILAAFDDAIADGVDLLSISLGGFSREFFSDCIAIGSFHAMKKGILTSCSAGNQGPNLYTITNVAPWIFTVAASSIDRNFLTKVGLGNGFETSGISANTFAPRKQMYPLISGELASTGGDESIYYNASTCNDGTLDKNKVKGKIVYCLDDVGQDGLIKDLGGAGVIFAIPEPTQIASTYLLSASPVLTNIGRKISQYINSTKNPQAIIYRTREVPMAAPYVANFSSRGPPIPRIMHNILKPDISAPGLNILAAYTKVVSITSLQGDNRFASFNILSGTSMSCPHVTGAAAYVKSFRPEWSPAAIKSALMTTATPMKFKDAEAELASGSGQINPTKAVHPGLVYDLSVSSYIRFLCKEGYNTTTIGKLMGGKKRYKCSDFKPARGSDGLNYPSMHTQLNPKGSKISAVFYRTVTHVEKGKSVYKATVTLPKGLSVEVVPSTLEFTRLNQKQSFKVVVKGSMENGTRTLSALLQWDDTKHSVRSPILIYRSYLPLL